MKSLPNGLAGGLDDLRLQHLKDMVGPSTDGGGHVSLSALVVVLRAGHLLLFAPTFSAPP